MTAVIDEAPGAPEAGPAEPEATAPAVAPAEPGAEVAVRAPAPSAMTISAKLQYAQMLAKSGLLPKEYRYNPANVLFGVEYGQMLGLQPMAAITGIHVIDGKPSASAGLIGALVRRAGHKLRVGYDAGKMTGWAEIVRHDDPGHTFRSEWDLDRAVTAELCTIRDGKPYAVDSKGKSLPWRKFFPSMTKARAITEAARDACEEVLFGLHYTPEELGAEVADDGSVITGEIVTADPWAAPAPVTDQDWLGAALKEAGAFTDLEAGRKLWRETNAKAAGGGCTAADAKRVQDAITARGEELKPAGADAAAQAAEADADIVDGEIVDAPPAETAALEAEDPWATAVEDILSDEDADAARANLRQAQKNGSIGSQRFHQVLAAIDERARLVRDGAQS